MYREGTLSLGPLSLPYTWLFLGISILAGYGVLTLLMRKDKTTRKILGSLLVNALLIFVGIWKISPLFFQWKAVTASPMLLLYLPGGLPGSLLGIAGAVVYLAVSLRKGDINFKNIYKPFIAGIGTALALGLIFNFVLLSPVPPVSQDAAARAETGSFPGDLAPDIKMRDIDGRERSLSDFRGKLVFLNFWATWCPPCKAEIPEMVRFYDKNGGRHFEIVAVNLTATESSVENVRTFVKERGMTFPVLLDADDLAEALFGIQAVPTTLVISPEGVILVRKTGSINGLWMKRQLSLLPE